MKKLKLLLLLLLPTFTFGQLQHSIGHNYGISSFLETVDINSYIMTAYSYSRGHSYGITYATDYRFPEKRFTVGSGLAVNYFSTILEQKEDSTLGALAYKNIEYKYSVSVPFRVQFLFEEWIVFGAGLSNSISLYANPENNQMTKYEKIYTLGYTANIDFYIAKKIIVGLGYYKDLTPSFDTGSLGLNYFWEQISFKVGYVIK